MQSGAEEISLEQKAIPSVSRGLPLPRQAFPRRLSYSYPARYPDFFVHSSDSLAYGRRMRAPSYIRTVAHRADSPESSTRRSFPLIALLALCVSLDNDLTTASAAEHPANASHHEIKSKETPLYATNELFQVGIETINAQLRLFDKEQRAYHQALQEIQQSAPWACKKNDCPSPEELAMLFREAATEAGKILAEMRMANGLYTEAEEFGETSIGKDKIAEAAIHASRASKAMMEKYVPIVSKLETATAKVYKAYSSVGGTVLLKQIQVSSL